MNKMSFELNENGMRLLAAFLARLVKEGVEYNIHQSESQVDVNLTGGY